MCVTSWNRDTFSLVDNVQHLYLPILSEIGAITLVKVFLVSVPQPKLCCVTTHLSGMCDVVVKPLPTTFTLNHFCSHCRFRPPSKPLSSQTSHKSLPPCHAPCALRAPLEPGIWLVLTKDIVHMKGMEKKGSKRIISVWGNRISILQYQFWREFGQGCFYTPEQVTLGSNTL